MVGAAVTALAFGWLWVAHAQPYDMLISSALLGVGIGLAFAALGNLIVQAVPAEQTGVAGGMNTVMRTLGGALVHADPGGDPVIVRAAILAAACGALGIPAS